MAKVLGIGGIFFKAKNPRKLAAWYAKWLGLNVQDWGGVRFASRRMPLSGYSVWAPFDAKTGYFKPSRKPFMVNLMVDDVEGMLTRIAKSGARVMPDSEASEFGRFGWFVDPEANKVELWEMPRRKQAKRRKR